MATPLIVRFVAIADDDGHKLPYFGCFGPWCGRGGNDGIGHLVHHFDLRLAEQTDVFIVFRQFVEGIPVDVFSQQAVGAEQAAADEYGSALEKFASVHIFIVGE